MLHTTAPTRLHQIVEHPPTNFMRGTKKSCPKARPATAADIYAELGEPFVMDIVTFDQVKKMKITE